MDDKIFEWLFAERKGLDFIRWAKRRNYNFSYPTLKRAKESGITTLRQRKMEQVAEEYRLSVQQRTEQAA